MTAQVRVYLPTTLDGLRAQAPPVGPAFAVTTQLHRTLAEDDQEYLEFVACQAAREACGALADLAGQAAGPAVVLAADLDAQAVRLPELVGRPRLERAASGAAAPGKATPAHPAAVVLTVPVTWADVVSIHVEDADGDLAWYDIGERADLLGGAN